MNAPGDRFSDAYLDRLLVDVHREDVEEARRWQEVADAAQSGLYLEITLKLAPETQSGQAFLFATRLMGAKLDGADLSDARITGDLSRASMRRARLDRADLSADIAQPVHGAHAGRLAISQAGWRELRECKSVARRSRICLAARCDPQGRQLGGADFLRADVTNTDFENGDVTSTRLIGLRGRDKARNLDRVRNLDRALND